MTHTNGKWTQGISDPTLIVAERLDKPVEPVICRLSQIPEYKSNASLIAAAPDLLEVLKWLSYEYKKTIEFEWGWTDQNENSDEWQYIKNTIAKAEGK